MRIAIVNDTHVAVEILSRVIASVPGYTIAWTASGGEAAVEKCARDKPDLILMDLVMPAMDGVEATARIMKNSPCAILVVTASIDANAEKVFEAMGYGALDAVCTPVLVGKEKYEGQDELLKKVATIGKLIGTNNSIQKKTEPENTPARRIVPEIVAIGSSTGGPKALAEILSRLPENLGAALVIVQHVDAKFAGGLAEWLNGQTGLKVVLAEEGMQPEENVVCVAGTNDHLVLEKNMTFSYTAEPRDYPYRPSVDTFFASLKSHWPGKGTAVLLTGIGKDGANGLLALKKAGWHTIAQDEESSVVYGMPKAAADIGAAVEILSLQDIGNAIIRSIHKKRGS
jgi:two-component system, chemotaxis family, response regulator WspF